MAISDLQKRSKLVEKAFSQKSSPDDLLSIPMLKMHFKAHLAILVPPEGLILYVNDDFGAPKVLKSRRKIFFPKNDLLMICGPPKRLRIFV